jgi:hypothetical protein
VTWVRPRLCKVAHVLASKPASAGGMQRNKFCKKRKELDKRLVRLIARSGTRVAVKNWQNSQGSH